jgi:hypothetical protein
MYPNLLSAYRNIIIYSCLVWCEFVKTIQPRLFGDTLGIDVLLERVEFVTSDRLLICT